MSTDLALVIGIVLGVLTVPAILSAIMDGSAPRIAAFSAIISGALIVYAVYNKPGGYSINDLPDVFTGVVGQFIR
jgi:hypothetical protein